MAHKGLVLFVGLIVAVSPASVAAQFADPPIQISPDAASDPARYCMHVEALTGSGTQTVQCWTRAEWADQGVDVDKEYPKEGVAIIKA
jgi:hypothetical protein